MPKVSFNKTATPAPASAASPVADAPVPDTTNPTPELEPVPGTALATRPAVAPPAPYSDEDISMEDVTPPRLNIVQKVGELSNLFDPGAIILNGEDEIDRPARILVLGFGPKRFVEKVPGGGRGNIVNTEREVNAAGGTLDYNEAKSKNIPLYQRLASALILVEKPDRSDPVNFPHEFEGHRYAIAVWNLKGTSYTHGAKKFFTAKLLGHLKGGYRDAFWVLDTELTRDQSSNNSYYIPKLKAAQLTTPEFKAWTVSLLGC